MNKLILVLIFAFCIFNFVGCVTIKEKAEGFLGISTREVEQARAGAIKKQFAYDYNTCYAKTKEALKQIGCYVYAEDHKKQLIAVYASSEDTTPVGVFFTSIDSANTQIEISSPSSYTKDTISAKIFAILSPKPEEGKTDAQEEEKPAVQEEKQIE